MDKDTAQRRTGQLFMGALPGLLIPLIILAGIWSSLFTATQAAAVSTVYALILELAIYREMKWQALLASLWAAGRTTAQVMLLVGCASMFSTALVRLDLQDPLIGAISQFADSRVVFLIAFNVLVLILGCLIDAVSILFIAVPILLPAALSLGIDPVHFGVILAVNLAIGQITPPVGVNLFVAASVAKEDLTAIVKEIWPFVAVEVLVLALVSALPALSLVH